MNGLSNIPKVIARRYTMLDVASAKVTSDTTVIVRTKTGRVDHWRYIPKKGWCRQ